MADTTPSQPDPGRQPGAGNGAEPAGQSPAPGGGNSRGVRQYHPSRGRRVGDAIIGVYARAAGRVSVGRRGDRRDYAIREVPAAEAGPILKRYVGVATATRPYFQADKDAPVEDFVAEADRHPVFELLPIGEDRPNEHHG